MGHTHKQGFIRIRHIVGEEVAVNGVCVPAHLTECQPSSDLPSSIILTLVPVSPNSARSGYKDMMLLLIASKAFLGMLSILFSVKAVRGTEIFL